MIASQALQVLWLRVRETSEILQVRQLHLARQRVGLEALDERLTAFALPAGQVVHRRDDRFSEKKP
ncbi:MAG: hypothetical protein A2X36_14250 [Elusimicrobia bacterium GWA2_69_24]|nr:MAG: hypothetical protein A2X36_14250 [Elusimicrobia bacterium GWA2_69_24]HBL17139.1 hypothetical protein [Elusimicrobiota bacterium]